MDKNALSAALLATALSFTVACSEAPTETVAKTEKAAEVEAPVTGKTAFWETYKLARGWSTDLMPLYVKSATLEGVKTKDGESALWTVMFVSPSKKEAREFTYRAITQGNSKKGVSSGAIQNWAGPVPKGQPFTTSEMKLDSNEAFEKAAANAADWLKANPGKAVSFYLGKESRFPAPVWAVLWGSEKAGAVVIVNALDGKILK